LFKIGKLRATDNPARRSGLEKVGYGFRRKNPQIFQPIQLRKDRLFKWADDEPAEFAERWKPQCRRMDWVKSR
jgi:hypothetical protein